MHQDSYVKRVYRQIISLALAAHVSYTIIFALLMLPTLAAYNVASVLFYCAMLLAVGRGQYRLAVSCIHVEVCLFVSTSTLIAGWGVGIALYLVALTSLTYFCPYKHRYVPYLFAVLEIFLFLALRLYTGLARPDHLAVPESAALWLYLYNACACFVFIIYAAFSSKVSAAVSQRELRDENRSLSVLANYDQLTGLLTRHAFLERVEQGGDGVISLALGDIDDFKAFNDTLGHACGDLVLREAAELIRRELGRESDVCRWGGEEFVFLFRGLPPEEARQKVQHLCDAIAAHTFCFDGQALHITMTFGISQGTNGISAADLVALADERMYQGKADGKNRVIGEP